MLLALFDFTGVAVFAVSGVLAAERAHLDLFGVFVLAAVTAIGGGTMRDLLMHREVFWLRDARYLFVVLAAAAVTLAVNRFAAVPANGLVFADALGLAFVAIAGAQIAEAAHLPGIVVILLGTLTGAGGGALRDVLTMGVPVVLRSSIYASAAVAGICAYLLLQRARVSRNVAAVLGVLLVAALRLGAVMLDWQLPVVG